jgi:hypothetical protein
MCCSSGANCATAAPCCWAGCISNVCMCDAVVVIEKYRRCKVNYRYYTLPVHQTGTQQYSQ